jgi:hypothetical protein
MRAAVFPILMILGAVVVGAYLSYYPTIAHYFQQLIW